MGESLETASATPASSMVFELELGCEAAVDIKHETVHLSMILDRVRQLCGSSSIAESKLMRDVRYYKALLTREEGMCDAVTLASKLANVGYRVSIRTALGGGSGTACFNNLSHNFLVVYDDVHGEYIVDTNFREHFRIPHPTPTYSALLNVIPEEFVGTAAKLQPLVQLITQQMTQAFVKQGLTCPPWRQAKSVLSKWLPARRKDYDLSQPTSPTSSLEFVPLRVSTGDRFDNADVLQGAYAPCMRMHEGIGWGGKGAAKGAVVGKGGGKGGERVVPKDAHLSLLSRTLSAGGPMVRNVVA